ncbi:MAG: hypothetical protein F7C35_06675 [Desulfurococcales archaeon]|nr:hypothetical protein [Desulfurococcales archaeon]
MQRPRMPRSERTVRMFLALYEEGPLHARELRDVAGLPTSRWVFPYLRYWIAHGIVAVMTGLYGYLYRLTVRGRMVVHSLLLVLEIREPEEAMLRILLRRLHSKGLRDRVYADVVRALYYMVKDKDRIPYVRGRTARELAHLFLTVLQDKGYTEEQIIEALETLREAGVILYSEPGSLPYYSAAFLPGFTRGTGIPSAPPKLGRGRRRRKK